MSATMKRQMLLAATLLLALPALGQQSIEYAKIDCIKANEMPVLQMRVSGKGELRAYFRRTNTTDWCSVNGQNDGLASRVILPIFDVGDEIEYFFVLVDGRRVVARSRDIYRAKATEGCETAFARHVLTVGIDCSETGADSIPTSLGAGYALRGRGVDRIPPQGSPDTPAPDQVPPQQP